MIRGFVTLTRGLYTTLVLWAFGSATGAYKAPLRGISSPTNLCSSAKSVDDFYGFRAYTIITCHPARSDMNPKSWTHTGIPRLRAEWPIRLKPRPTGDICRSDLKPTGWFLLRHFQCLWWNNHTVVVSIDKVTWDKGNTTKFNGNIYITNITLFCF